MCRIYGVIFIFGMYRKVHVLGISLVFGGFPAVCLGICPSRLAIVSDVFYVWSQLIEIRCNMCFMCLL